MENAKPNKHLIFVNDEEKFENFDLPKYFNTVPELMEMQYNRISEE
jgi:hypothetical protein